MVEVLFTQVKTPGLRSAKGLRCLQEPKKQRRQDSWGPGGNQEKVCSLAAWALSLERKGEYWALYTLKRHWIKTKINLSMSSRLQEPLDEMSILLHRVTSSFSNILLPVLWIGYSFLEPSLQEKGPWDNLRPSAQRQEMWLWIPSGYSENWIKASCYVILYLLGPQVGKTGTQHFLLKVPKTLTGLSMSLSMQQGWSKAAGIQMLTLGWFAQTTKPLQPEKCSWKEEVPTKVG